jgi:hypothetical protein
MVAAARREVGGNSKSTDGCDDFLHISDNFIKRQKYDF